MVGFLILFFHTYRESSVCEINNFFIIINIDDYARKLFFKECFYQREHFAHDLDEIILHVQKTNGADEGQLRRDLSERCYRFTDIHPNRISFHDAEEMQQLQGVGRLIKEQKLVDHRPKATATETTTPS